MNPQGSRVLGGAASCGEELGGAGPVREVGAWLSASSSPTRTQPGGTRGRLPGG